MDRNGTLSPKRQQPLEALICPVCAGTFSLSSEGTLGVLCESGHRFDFSRHRYLNLLTGSASKSIADSAEMVKARAAFLSVGHFQLLSEGLAHSFSRFAPRVRKDSVLLDAGCGTGHYLSGLLAGPAAGFAAIGLDLSAEALRQAVRANPELLAVVWDLWRPLPLAANSVDAVVVVFAPRNIAEFQRVLRPDGVLLIATPLPDHLSGLPPLAGRVGQQPGKHAALHSAVAGAFETLDETELHAEVDLSNQEAVQLMLMGPTGHHLDSAAMAALDQPDYQVEIAFRVSAFRPVPMSPEPPVLQLPRR